MSYRKRIKNKWLRLLFLPFAFIQWLILTLMFSVAGGFFIFILGVTGLIQNLILFNDMEDIILILKMLALPIILPFIWWYDYITKGEIGMYEDGYYPV